MSNPVVAVIIPTYNRWPLLGDAIESVLQQRYAPLACVVVDDGSTDNTAAHLKRQFGDRVTLLVNDTNREKSYCRNRGVREISADYVCFLDSDDVLTPDAVADRMRIFLNDHRFSGVAYGVTAASVLPAEQIDRYPDRLNLAGYLQDKSGLRTNSYLLKRDTMLQFGMYNERLTNREDIELFIRLLAHLEFRFCHSQVSVYRVGAPARARDNWAKIIQQGTALTDVLAENTGVMQALGEHYQCLRADEYRELLRALFRSRSYEQYRAAYRRARSEGVMGWEPKSIKRYLLSFLPRRQKQPRES